jgi:excisionase family DNA binding protein
MKATAFPSLQELESPASALTDRWLSVEEVGTYLGVSRDTVYRWIKERQLPARPIGRLWKFKRTQVDSWVQAGAGEA